MSHGFNFIELSSDLNQAGLVWHPEIGDEVTEKPLLDKISILVDPQGKTPKELRDSYLWLPTVEQLVFQFEARQAFIFHAGINSGFAYEAVIKTTKGMIEESGNTLRLAFGKALKKLLSTDTGSFH